MIMNRLITVLATASLLLVAMAAPAAAATSQTSEVYTFADLPALVDVGDAALVRNDNGVTVRATVEGVAPGAYTLWWVVWNNPEACGADGCTDADFGAPGLDVDIGYATGQVVGTGGQLTLAAHLAEGGSLSGFPTEFGVASGSGLLDAFDAEVHIVIRYHGPKVTGLVGEKTHTFAAGCDYSAFGGSIVSPAYGTEGPTPYICEEPFFAIFPPAA
jgi:hypothetical protein